MSTDSAESEALAKAAHSYKINKKDWDFLGYSEAIALAVLTEFFSMGKLRNPSQKPLNVLSMVGKSRVKAIADAVKMQLPSKTEEEDDKQ
jgi:ERCC4-type nuclease